MDVLEKNFLKLFGIVLLFLVFYTPLVHHFFFPTYP
jgi:hypothetical protein